MESDQFSLRPSLSLSVHQRIELLQQQHHHQPPAPTSTSSTPTRAPSMTPNKSSPASSDRFRPALNFWQTKDSSQSSINSPSSTSSAIGSAASPDRRMNESPSARSDTLVSPLKGKSSSKAKAVMGLEDELEEQDRESMAAREAITMAPAAHHPTAVSFLSDDSRGSMSSPKRNASPWNSQVEWAKHESFVHPLDVLTSVDRERPVDGILDDEDDVASPPYADSSKARRPVIGKGQDPDKDASFTWAASSSSAEEDDDDDDDESPPLPNTIHSLDTKEVEDRLQRISFGSTPNMESDTFYDAQAGPSSSPSPPLAAETNYQLSLDGADKDKSFLHFSPRPQNISTPSSSTLRQDAAFRSDDHDLHHQTSTSTLLGVVPARSTLDADPPSTTSSRAQKRMSIPLVLHSSPKEPLLPPPPVPSKDDKTSGLLGPSGTIRGRPRGATVGAVPAGGSMASQRVRPRSMLSEELSSDNDGPTRQSSSPSRSLQRKRNSIGMSGDGEAYSQSSLNTNRTQPSGSGYSSPGGMERSSTTRTSESGGSRSRSGSTASLLQQVQYPPKSHASFVIAVVGHRGVGKSTLIRKGLRQFGLSKPNAVSDKITSHSTLCIVDSEQRTIEVLEIDASLLLNNPSRRFTWPRFLPRIDGVILCYDATQISSFRGMSELLENFSSNSLCTLMMACKSESEPKAVNPFYASDMAAVYNIGLAECELYSAGGKKNMRDCFSFVVKDVAKMQASGGAAAKRAKAAPAGGVMAAQGLDSEALETIVDGDGSSRGLVKGDESPASSTYSDGWKAPASVASSGRLSEASADEMHRRAEGDNQAAVKQIMEKTQQGLQVAQTAGGYVGINELWDKLFYAAVSGNDERYLLMFMVFYRGFVKPVDLLKQLISRFDALSLGEQRDSVMIRYSLMRLTTMLCDWMQEYPGDLSGPETYPTLCSFFKRLQLHPATMHIVSPMMPLLEAVKGAPDLDAKWAKDQYGQEQTQASPPAPADASPSKAAQSPVLNATDASDGRSRSGSTSSVPEAFISVPRMLRPIQNRERSASDVTDMSEGQQSATSGSSFSEIASSSAPGGQPSSMGSSSAMLTSPAQSQGSSALATALDQKTILRNVSNAMLETREDLIAHELTRAEWVLFSEVGSRDLLRHILVSRAHRSKDSPVAKSIAHFNYVSSWVCSMILIQSKTKVRARLLEKFMEIAGILRRVNNYNTLHAVLAGLGNASIHRLKRTRELLDGKPVIKTYQSLARLMGSDRSFAAYRLALENSAGRTIPYLGVHLQDILSMSDGNPSRRESDGMIHWRKFSLMDEAVMAIVRCQQYQEPLKENPLVSKMILNLPLMDEDELYQRSLQVEPRQNNAAAPSASSRIIKQFFNHDA